MPGGRGRRQPRPRRARTHRGPAQILSVGIDLGGTKLLGVALDDDGTVVAEHRAPTPAGAAAVVDALNAAVDALGPAASVGVGAPGLVDRAGVLRVAPNLAGVRHLDLRSAIQSGRPGVRVRIDNDATCAAWAEHRVGAATGATDAVLVTLGTGIGAGAVIGGRLARGANGFAGEVGHMVVDPHGPPCPCGRTGCWERFASGRGLGRLAREAAVGGRAARVLALADGDPESVRGEHVTQAVSEGDDEARALMAGFAWWVALGLANLAAALDPEVFVLGGGLVEAGEILLAPTRAAFADLVLGGMARPPVRIVPATLGEHAGAIGAALVARDNA